MLAYHLAAGRPNQILFLSPLLLIVVTICVKMDPIRRFQRSKQVASYLGLIPREYSSGGKQRRGGLSKQGNRLLRFLLVESANIVVRFDPVFRKEYLHRCHQKYFTVAKVAAARKLAIRMYWILWTQTPYPQVALIEGSLKCILVSESQTVRLSRRSRTQQRLGVRIMAAVRGRIDGWWRTCPESDSTRFRSSPGL